MSMRIVKIFAAAAMFAIGLTAFGVAQARAADNHIYCMVTDYGAKKVYFSPTFTGDYGDREDFKAEFLRQVSAKYAMGGGKISSYCFAADTPAGADAERKESMARKAEIGMATLMTNITPARAAPQPDVELECAMQTGSQNVEASGGISLSPNGSWRLSFNPSRRTVTMKKWFAYNAPAVTQQPTAVSVTADQIKFCLLASGCSDDGMTGYVKIDRRTRDLQWNYIVGLEREYGPMFQTVMYGKCDLFKEKPQAF